MVWSSSGRTLALSFAAAAMLFFGCSGSDGGGGTAGTGGTGGMPAGRVLETGLFGTVMDASGQPLEGVTVTVNEVSATTNADGEFVIETSVTGSTVARFRADGYLPTVRKLAIAEGSPTAAHVTLKPRGLATSMSADTGGTAMGDRQASVTVEPGDLSGPDGSSVTGMIDVYVTPVDPSLQDEVQALTGSFDDGVNLLESFGMVFITIMQGNIELGVAVGQTLVVIIPAPAGAAPSELPDTMPLWSLNQQTGQWEEEGTLTLDETSNAFVGEVDRMASWNADVPAASTCITGLAVDDEEGDPIAGAEVDTTGLDYFGSSTGSTGDEGRFYIPVRKSSQILVSASHDAEGGASREVMSGAEDTALPPTPGDARCLDIGTFTVRRKIVIVPEPTNGGTGGTGGSGGSGGSGGTGGVGGIGGMVVSLPDPIATWSFSGDAKDNTGNGNDGSVQGAVLTDDRFGNPDSAYSFDGVDDIISYGPGVKPNFPFTFNAWIRPTDIENHRGIIATDDVNANGNTWGAAMDVRSGGIVHAAVYSGFANFGTRRDANTDGVIAADEWQMVTSIFSSIGDTRIYVDGVEVPTTSDGGGASLRYSSASGTIGRTSRPAPLLPFEGDIDDVSVFDVALSEDEVQALFTREGPFGDAPARVRVAHLAPEIPTVGNTAIDVFINGELSPIQDLTFGSSTGFIELPPGGHLFGIAPANGEPAFTFPALLTRGQVATLVAIRTVNNRGVEDPVDVLFFDESLEGLQQGNGRLLLGHGADDTTIAIVDGINTNTCPPAVVGFEDVMFGTVRGPGDFAVGVEPGALAAPDSCAPLAGPFATPVYPSVAVLSVAVDLDTDDGSLDVVGYALIGDVKGAIPIVPKLGDEPGAGGCDVGLCALDQELKALCEASLTGCLGNVDPSRMDECFLGAPVICQATDRDIAYEDNFDDGVATQWFAIDTLGSNTIEEVNGRVEFTFPSGQAGSSFFTTYRNVCTMTGDFDMQVDYELIDWPVMNGMRGGIAAFGPSEVFRYGMTRLSFGDPLTDFPGAPRESYIVNVTPTPLGPVGTSDFAGTLRLERVGTTINGYYRSASSSGSWVLVESKPGILMDDASIDLSLSPVDLNTNQQVKVALDNFAVTSGQVTCEGCGDGVLGGGESCDDGNVLDGDGCSRACSLE